MCSLLELQRFLLRISRKVVLIEKSPNGRKKGGNDKIRRLNVTSWEPWKIHAIAYSERVLLKNRAPSRGYRRFNVIRLFVLKTELKNSKNFTETKVLAAKSRNWHIISWSNHHWLITSIPAHCGDKTMIYLKSWICDNLRTRIHKYYNTLTDKHAIFSKSEKLNYFNLFQITAFIQFYYRKPPL